MGQTILDWRGADQKPTTFTLYADGTLANAKGQTKNYRWWWTEETLLIRFYSGRFVLTPVPGEAGRFTGQSVPHQPGDPVTAVEVTAKEPDGAGVLSWLQPLTDGVHWSVLERRAAAEAHAVVVRRLHSVCGKLDAAARKADRCVASLEARSNNEETAATVASVRRDWLGSARAKQRKDEAWLDRTINPYYSWASFHAALTERNASQDRRFAAELDLDRARADLGKATDRRLRAEADLRVAEAEYIIARSDYESAYWLAWRPEYLKRKAMRKAEAEAARLRTSRPRPSSPAGSH